MAKNIKITKVNIPMCIASFLFCLTLISFHFTSGLYARYISAASGSDSARVAGFGNLTLTETGDFYQDNKLMIIPGVDLTKKATVDFSGSETATYVFAEVIVPAWTASTDNKSFSFLLNGRSVIQWNVAPVWNFLEADNGIYVYYVELAPNSPMNNADIIANNGKITVSDSITKTEIKTITDISVKLRATAVQCGGFESPAAAWASVSAKGVNV